LEVIVFLLVLIVVSKFILVLRQ